MNTAVLTENWVGQIIDRRFPLLESLGNMGGHRAFRTESQEAPGQRALIKVIPVTGAEADEQLDIWARAARMTHPHLTRLFASGLCTVEGTRVMYVVTEFPEEGLAQLLPQRALTAQETAEMLKPVVDALEYVHDKGLVYGAFAPLDVLVVQDQVKLAIDTLHRPGPIKAVNGAKRTYEAPETLNGAASPASDVWSLGITLIEALTQRPPMNADPVVPSTMPAPFGDIARRCLKADPAQRCTLAQIKQILEPARPAPVAASVPGPVTSAAGPAVAVAAPALLTEKEGLGRSGRNAWENESDAHTPKWQVPALIAAAVILLIVIGVAVIRSHKPQPAAQTDQASAATSATTPNHTATGLTQPGSVQHRVMPDVSPRSYKTIRGKIDVKIRANVDAQGSVSNATIQSRDHSRYFANLALDAARKWKFKPAQSSGQNVASVWNLQFVFRKNRTDVNPVETTP